MIDLIQADALDWLEREAQAGPRFDLIITDPPYWTLNKWRNIGTTTRLGGNRDKSKQRDEMWFETIDAQQLFYVMAAFDNLLKDNRHCYVMCDDETSDLIRMWLSHETICFNYGKRLIWDKIDAGMGYHWRATYEFILMLEKGKRRLNDLSRKDILRYKRVQGKHYPTEKPFGLVEELILNSTNEDDWVLDPFCGSGVVGDVCKRHNRNAVLIDKSPLALEWSRKRIDEAESAVTSALLSQQPLSQSLANDSELMDNRAGLVSETRKQIPLPLEQAAE